jgi:hypothetical protein
MGGLGSEQTVNEIVGFLGSAKKGSVEDYANEVLKRLTQILLAQGVPPVQAERIEGRDDGQFDRTQWKLGVNLDPADIKDKHSSVSSTLIHELRHAQQWFQMARVLAARGSNAQAIATSLSIPLAIAQKAVKASIVTAEEVDEAAPWLASVLSGKHKKVLDLFERAGNIKAEAAAGVEAIRNRSGGSDPAAESSFQKVKELYSSIYKSYTKLPLEADARKVENAVAEGLMELDEDAEEFAAELEEFMIPQEPASTTTTTTTGPS